MFVIQQMIKLVLSGSLVILLALSSIVRAQQPQSQTLTIDRKQTSIKPSDEQPPAILATEADDKQDVKLAVYQV
ncbi:MAG TPA: hypothetical protein VFT26_06435, partial [Pyrinomonadaceae bacterium]|nr:hypothetical protein [Pyrinomonadaceae bacterium]